MRTARSVFYGGPRCGQEFHPSVDAQTVLYDEQIYFRSDLQDSEKRQVFMVKRGRCTYPLPKQNHFPEH